MSKQHIETLLEEAIKTLQQSMLFPGSLPRIQVDATKDKQHGDFATNIALVLAKKTQQKPRDIAEVIVKAIPSSDKIKKIDIAGPVFINFFLTPHAFHSVISHILSAKTQYGHSNKGKNQRVIVEFVSSNPTGPLHVGHGRHGAYGAVLSDLLEAVGYKVHREYYVNDAGRQMNILAASVFLRYLSLGGESIVFPVNAYQGDYVIDIAKTLKAQEKNNFIISSRILFETLPPDEINGGDKETYIDALIARIRLLLGEAKYETLFDVTLDAILQDISEDLAEFGVSFQEWFSERKFVQGDAVNKMIDTLAHKNLTYEKEGALWFRATDFGDEKDRVLQRSNGTRTYFANDLAYHQNKFERGFELAINIFGSDHHGYVPRVKAGLKALGIPEEKWVHRLLQFVTLYRGGVQAQMSTRSGSFVTLRELRQEVGNDAARFFYVMRRAEQHVDFDLDLAKSQSNDNPVYYLQYAHARICSVFRQMAEKSLSYDEKEGLMHVSRLIEPHELQVLNTLSRYPDMILNAAEYYEPHILTLYLRDLATDFHAYYNSHQFLVDDALLRQARLALISAIRQVLANGLLLLGISAPENM